MTTLCYVNGEICSAHEAAIGVADLGFQRGYGVFDFVGTYNRKLFHFDDHLKRLRSSAEQLHLKLSLSDAEIHEISRQLIAESDLATPSVRLILTGGLSSITPLFEQPSFVIIAEELPSHSTELYERGVSIISYKFQRELPQVKSLNYLNALRLEPVKREKGVFDILYYSEHGITECPRNNFFIFGGDVVVTPADNVLLGITRKIILQLAGKEFEVEERAVSLDELRLANEAFITSTGTGVLPVTQVDDLKIGNGRVGERTKRIMQLFNDYTSNVSGLNKSMSIE